MEAIFEDISKRCEPLWHHQQREHLLQVGVAAEKVVPLLTWLQRHTAFVQLTHLSVVDWIEDDEFQLTYLLTDPQGCQSLMLCCRIPRQEASAESVHMLWPQAVTYEQEINEMYGIQFSDSPRQGVPFLLEGWDDMPPMRRDFDTVAFCKERHPDRPGREQADPNRVISVKFGQKGYLHD